ncbi:MAG: HAD-IA family hydrolase [bacterium]|nr:HAD-IA family hydrolase [bacterium]
MFKTLLIDFSGVVVVDGFWHWLHEKVPNLDFFSSKILELARQWDKGEITCSDGMKQVSEMINIPFKTMWSEMKTRFFLNQELVDYLKTLKSEYKLVIFSNFPRDLFNEILNSNKLQYLFDSYIISSDLKKIKPNPDIYLEVLKILKLKNNEVIFIDDKQENIDTAIQLGITSIKYTNLPELKISLCKLL